jgi:putative peptidoglycan lipid II flippase
MVAARLSVGLGTLAALQLAAGFALQLVVLGSLGVGSQTDAWVAAQAVPMVALAAIAVSFQGAWQTKLSTHVGSRQDWVNTQRAAHGQLLLVYGSALLGLGLSADTWTSLIFPGLSLAQRSFTADMSRIFLAAALFSGHSTLFTTALRGQDRYVVGEVVSLCAALVALVVAALVVRPYGVQAVAWVSLARGALCAVALFVLADRPWPDIGAGIKDSESWRQLRPMLLGASIYKTTPLVDRFWSSLAPTGGLTIFNLLHTALAAAAMVLERALCIPVAPRLARLAQAQEWDAMRSLVRQTLSRGAWVVGGVAIAIVLLQPVWPALLGSFLKMDDAAARDSWWICATLLGYLYPAAVGSVIVSSFYAMADARTPVAVGIAGFVVSLALKAAGFALGGIPGLAFAVSLHYLGNMAAMWFILERRFDAKSRIENR